MTSQISPITRQSYRQAAEVLARAFVDDPVSVVTFRNYDPIQRVKALRVDFTAELLECVRRGYPIQAVESEQIVASAAIYPPGTYPLPAWVQLKLLAKSILGNGFYDIRSWLTWLEEVDKLRPASPHYYLEYLGVDTGYQGRGFGSRILRHLAERADEAGVGCYLENANSLNLTFYQRAGFRVVEQREIIGVRVWLMWREPSSKSQKLSPKD